MSIRRPALRANSRKEAMPYIQIHSLMELTSITSNQGHVLPPGHLQCIALHLPHWKMLETNCKGAARLTAWSMASMPALRRKSILGPSHRCGKLTKHARSQDLNSFGKKIALRQHIDVGPGMRVHNGAWLLEMTARISQDRC